MGVDKWRERVRCSKHPNTASRDSNAFSAASVTFYYLQGVSLGP